MQSTDYNAPKASRFRSSTSTSASPAETSQQPAKLGCDPVVKCRAFAFQPVACRPVRSLRLLLRVPQRQRLPDPLGPSHSRIYPKSCGTFSCRGAGREFRHPSTPSGHADHDAERATCIPRSGPFSLLFGRACCRVERHCRTSHHRV